ncbi:MAG: hypothetical protein EXS46_02895 [Candidatus Taylorbacteria bacterium]|nr:hypothetical protein [Candidatus Taylorbacteria bacterium]
MKKPEIYKIKKIRTLFLSILIGNLLVFSAYVWMFFEIQKKNLHIADLVKKVEAINEKQKLFSVVKEKVAETAEKRKQLDLYAISKDGMVPFLNYFQTLENGKNISFKLNSVEIVPSDISGDIYEIVKINLEGTGEWSDVYNFVSLTELMPYKINIEKVELGKGVNGSRVSGQNQKFASSGSVWKIALDFGVLKLK